MSDVLKVVRNLFLIAFVLALFAVGILAVSHKAFGQTSSTTSTTLAPSNLVYTDEASIGSPAYVKVDNASITVSDINGQKKMFVVSDENLVPPDWLQTLVKFGLKLPYVGPAIVKVLQWSAVIGSFLTMLSLFMMGTAWLLSKSIGVLGMEEKAEKVKLILDKIIYYLKFFSQMNAVKKP